MVGILFSFWGGLFSRGYVCFREGTSLQVRSLRGDKKAQVNGSNSTTNVSLIGSLFIGGFVMGFEDLNRLQDLSQTGKSCKACLKVLVQKTLQVEVR